MTYQIIIQIEKKVKGVAMPKESIASEQKEVQSISQAISETRKNEIKTIAEEIILKNKLAPGFDLVKFLTTHEGFVVGTKEMAADTTGVLMINLREPIGNTGSNKLIIINESLKVKQDFKLRRRFITAHEYGHAVLHAKERLFAHRDTSDLKAPLEQEAEFFARCFLMPEDRVRELLDISRIHDNNTGLPALISLVFKVTEKKARIRMEELGLV